MVANICLNGSKADSVLAERVNLTNLLHVGKNTVEIVLHSSLRNLFGPHHWDYETEPLGVGMDKFWMRGKWRDMSFPYSEKHKLVPFGLDKIILEKYR